MAARTDTMSLVAFMQAGSTSVYAGSWGAPPPPPPHPAPPG